MQKIEAVIQPSKLDAVKDALVEIGVQGMTITEARGHGRQKGHTEFYRGREYSVDLLPKIKLEMVTTDDMAAKAISGILGAARTRTSAPVRAMQEPGERTQALYQQGMLEIRRAFDEDCSGYKAIKMRADLLD